MKGFKTWHKLSTEIRCMLKPIIVLFIAHEFITGNFRHNRLVVLRLNVPVNNFSVMSGRSHRFLGN